MGKNVTIICTADLDDTWLEGHSYLAISKADGSWDIESEKGTINKDSSFFNNGFKEHFRYKRYNE